METIKLTSSKLYETALKMLNSLVSLQMKIDGRNRVKHERAKSAFFLKKYYFIGELAH